MSKLVLLVSIARQRMQSTSARLVVLNVMLPERAPQIGRRFVSLLR